MNNEIIGYIGAFLLIITSLPQIYKTFKSKKTDDISIYFILLQLVTCIFFLTYGILIVSNPIILSNSILLFELFILLYAKIKFSYCNNIHNIIDDNIECSEI